MTTKRSEAHNGDDHTMVELLTEIRDLLKKSNERDHTKFANDSKIMSANLVNTWTVVPSRTANLPAINYQKEDSAYIYTMVFFEDNALKMARELMAAVTKATWKDPWSTQRSDGK